MIIDDGSVRVIDLIRAGFLVKLFGIVVIFLISIVLLPSVFHLDDVRMIFNETSSILNVTFQWWKQIFRFHCSSLLSVHSENIFDCVFHVPNMISYIDKRKKKNNNKRRNKKDYLALYTGWVNHHQQEKENQRKQTTRKKKKKKRKWQVRSF